MGWDSSGKDGKPRVRELGACGEVWVWLLGGLRHFQGADLLCQDGSPAANTKAVPLQKPRGLSPQGLKSPDVLPAVQFRDRGLYPRKFPSSQKRGDS